MGGQGDDGGGGGGWRGVVVDEGILSTPWRYETQSEFLPQMVICVLFY